MVSERSERKKIKPWIKDDKVCVIIIMSGYAPGYLSQQNFNYRMLYLRLRDSK